MARFIKIAGIYEKKDAAPGKAVWSGKTDDEMTVIVYHGDDKPKEKLVVPRGTRIFISAVKERKTEKHPTHDLKLILEDEGQTAAPEPPKSESLPKREESKADDLPF